jgi:hypothetical protein
MDSPPAEFSLSPASNVSPGDTRGFPRHDTARSSLNFGSPGRFDISRVFGLGVVQAGQEFGGDIGAFIEGQRENFA